MALQYRRVVTGDDSGAPFFAGDAVLTWDKAIPRITEAVVWKWDTRPTVPNDGTRPAAYGSLIFPPPGGVHVRFVRQVPPTAAELAEHEPNAVDELMEEGGVHISETVDFVVIMQGSVEVGLPGVGTRSLSPGNVVMNGTKHSWTVGPEGCTLLAVVVGASSA